jgi:hypothetical protein
LTRPWWTALGCAGGLVECRRFDDLQSCNVFRFWTPGGYTKIFAREFRRQQLAHQPVLDPEFDHRKLCAIIAPAQPAATGLTPNRSTRRPTIGRNSAVIGKAISAMMMAVLEQWSSKARKNMLEIGVYNPTPHFDSYTGNPWQNAPTISPSGPNRSATTRLCRRVLPSLAMSVNA